MSKAEEIEDKIREQRILEANKKGLMGQNGKIGVVLKIFGSPIIAQSQGGVYVDTNYLDDIYSQKKSLEECSDSVDLMRHIPIMNIDQNERPTSQEWHQGMQDPINYSTDFIGMHFDGLSRGMHLEIKYEELSSELVVYHKGYVVYKEIKGELLGYAPNQEWENWIESLYKKAKEKLRILKEEEFEKSIKINKQQKENWWQNIIKKWGIQ
jgi:hypothetical protein